MRARITTLAAFAMAAMFAATAGAQAKTVTCSDGTTSTATGKGACSGHGGVKKAEKKAESSAKKAEEKGETKAQEKAEQTAAKTAKKSEKKAEGSAKKAASSGAEKSVAKKEGAQVTCTDGTMSKPGRGACSHHGGVKKG